MARTALVLAVHPIQPAIDPQSLEAPRVGIENFELKGPRSGHQLAADRHAASQSDDVAGQGIDFLRNLSDFELRADDSGDILKLGSRISEEGAVGLLDYGRRSVLIVLVGDLAHDLLHNIFNRNNTV